ncbi:MAG TPA: helical backbone metal receptor [Myxococcota bacterium]|nr:helical backbone metal receptor [Myxococcota bacterium]
MPEAVRALSLALALALCAACRESPRADLPGASEPRIVSLSPSTTGILIALGARGELVGVDQFSHELPGCAEIPALGGLFAPDLERTLELRPSIVVGVRSESQAAFFAALRARGVTVHELDTGGSLEAVLANYETLGGWIGRSAEGRALAQHARDQLADVARSVADRPRPSVALVVERDPLYVAAGGSFASALIDAAGGRNVFAELDRPYPQVSLELLAERAPDVLIDSTQSSQGPEAQAAARAYWARFPWAKRIELVPPGVATLPGAELARGAELLRARIHPELAS